MVKLIFNDQNGWERSVELNDQNNVMMIGRNGDCGIQTNNASVSRVHAMLTWRNGKLFVQDPPNGAPTNGTKVDGMRLHPNEVLELFAGSELLCGNFSIRVAQDETQGQDSVPLMGEQALQIPPVQASPVVYANNQPQTGYAAGNPRMGYQAQPNGRGAYGPDRNPRGMQPPGLQMPMQAQPQVPSQNMPPQTAMPQSPQGGSSGSFPSVEGPRAMRGRAPQHYGPHAPGGMAAPPQPAAQPASVPTQTPAVTSEELTKLQDENASLRQQLEEIRSGAVSKDDSVRELETKLEERDQILTDYERRIEYHETVVTGLKDMIDKLKEQLEHQKEQYQECRRDLVTSQDEAENLKLELSTLKENLESKGMATSNAETAIADLKVQLQQKIRLLADLQRELDLAQFSCKEERDNVERLKENVETLNETLEESQRRNRDMKKVVEQHEMMFSELKGNLDDRAREIRQLQDSLRSKGGADSAALMQELSQVRDSLNKKTSECDMYQKQLHEAEEAASDAKNSSAEIDALKEKLKDAEADAAKAAAQSDSKLQAIKTELDALTNENRQLAAELRDAKENAGNGCAAADPEFLDTLRGHYQNINDVVCQWREDFRALEDSIGELQRVFVAYVKIDVNNLVGQDKTRLENVLRDHDPKLIFEDIGNYLDASQNSLHETKEKLKALRSALHG